MSGTSSSSSRVSIPNSLRKTIQNLKEIAKNHSDDEIYAMLRECSMDPNETAQKLLFQDPFHEVKRKRDKRKESNKEPSDNRWRPASQGQGGRSGGRGNYTSRYVSHDSGGERNTGKENGLHQATDRGITSSSLLPSQDMQSKSATHESSSVAGLPDISAKIENLVTVQGPAPKDSSVSGTISVKESLEATLTDKNETPSTGDAKSSIPMQRVSTSGNNFVQAPKPASGSGLYASASDPVLVASPDVRIPGSMGTIKREVGRERITVEAIVNKGSSEMNHSSVHEKMQGKSQGFDGNRLSEASQTTHSLSRTSSAGSRPSSNYSNRSQQLNGPQKVGPTKEWKPKSTNVKPTLMVGKYETIDVEPATQTVALSIPSSSSLSSDEPTSKLQQKLGELQFSDTKHVIIPNHLQVPESERSGLSFGSFDANFGLTTNFVNDGESKKSFAELSQTTQEIGQNVEMLAPSIQIASPSAQEADIADSFSSPAEVPENLTSSADHPQSQSDVPENLTSREPELSSTIPAAPEYDQAKTEAAPATDSSQHPVVHTSPPYSNFGLVSQMLGNQFATVEGAEPQARDATRIPSFLVQQPFDPATSYYTSMYRPTTAEADGRLSPFFATAPATKYNGNIALLPAQTGQTPQESGSSLVLSSTGPAPLVTSGLMQTSLAVGQQSVPVFRQPPGVHIPYAPNFLPYNQYFSSVYIPSPTMHPFLSNAAFPQQPPAGNIYPTPGAAGAAPIKYSLSQYKPAANACNPSHLGMPAYGTYTPGAVSSGSSTGSEDLASSQYKENNVYIAGQQSEGSVWIPTPGRDISSVQATSFYNLPAQGQHMAFPGIYHHPTQAVAAGTVHPMLQQSQAMAGAVEMVGPPSGVYQQPQRTQINWVNNY